METKQSISTGSRNLSVDTGGKCFLCCKNVVKDVTIKQEFQNNPPLNSDNVGSLLSIARHLNLNMTDLINNAIGEENVWKQNEHPVPSDFPRISDLAVTMCPECCIMVTRLSELCLEFEAVQMKLIHQLKSFNGAMEFSGSGPTGDQLNAANTLRQEIMTECKRKLNGVPVPRVIVEKTELKIIPSTIPSSPPSPLESDSRDSSHPPPDCTFPQNNMASTCEVTHHKPGEDNYKYHCPLCNHKIHVKDTKSHNIRHHVDTLLTAYKLPQFCLSEFKEYCYHVFKVELLRCSNSKDCRGKVTLVCPNCPKSYTTHFNVHYHLFSEHKELIGKKLVELQKSTGLEEIRATKLPLTIFLHSKPRAQRTKRKQRTDSMDSSRKDKLTHAVLLEDTGSDSTIVRCTLCDPSRHMTLEVLMNHQIRLHREAFLDIYKAPEVSMTDFKLYCDKTFKEQQLKVYDSKGIPNWKCRICSKELSDERYMSRHFVFKHNEYLGKNIQELQANVPVAEMRDRAEKLEEEKEASQWICLRCGTGYLLETSLKRHLRHECEFGPKIARPKKRKHKCDVCGQDYRSPLDLQRHKNKVHKYLREWLPEENQ